MTATLTDIALGILILAVVCYRQLRVRPLAPNYRPAVIIGVVGLALTAEAVRRGTGLSVETVGTSVVGLALAAALAWPRARSMRVFRRGGRWLTRGTWLTVVWWLVLIAGHVGIVLGWAWLAGHPPQPPTSLDQDGLLLALAVSLGLQSYFRGRRIPYDAAADGEPIEAGATSREWSR